MSGDVINPSVGEIFGWWGSWGRECTDPPWETCSDAGCPVHGFDRDEADEEIDGE